MTKKQILVKLSAYKVVIGVMTLVIMLVGGFIVRAYSSSGEAPKVVAEAGSVVNFNEASIADLEDSDEGTLGASTADYAYRTLMDVNGDQTYHVSQTFIDASTTIVSIPNPFLTVSSTSNTNPVLKTDGTVQYQGVTTTVDFVGLRITGAATSSYSIVCGSSADATSAGISIHLLGSGTVATSSLAYIENNLIVINGATVTGSSTAKIMLTPALPYFKCIAVATGGGDGTPITQTSNTFDGNAMVRFNRIR